MFGQNQTWDIDGRQELPPVHIISVILPPFFYESVLCRRFVEPWYWRQQLHFTSPQLAYFTPAGMIKIQ